MANVLKKALKHCDFASIFFTLSSSSISEIFRSIARFSRFSFSDNELLVACRNVNVKGITNE